MFWITFENSCALPKITFPVFLCCGLNQSVSNQRTDSIYLNSISVNTQHTFSVESDKLNVGAQALEGRVEAREPRLRVI